LNNPRIGGSFPGYGDTDICIARHRYYDASNAWSFQGYKYSTKEVRSLTGANFSTLTMTLNVKRYYEFYQLTMFIPVIILAVLSSAGIFLPGKKPRILHRTLKSFS